MCSLSFGHFLPVHGNVFRRGNAQPYLIALDPQDGYGDVLTNANSFTEQASQNQHGNLHADMCNGRRIAARYGGLE